jgi:16S rRNA (cytosine1402-N4)-methyltransferase
MKRFLKNLGFTKVNGILADLGVSSFQINTPERGFSYRFDSKLDMRMDKKNKLDAYQVVNNYSFENLSRVFFDYGDLNNSKKISEEIINARSISELKTTFDLNKILKPLFPERFFNKNLSRIYQAIRIEVNNEMDVLKSLLNQSCELLVPGGRLCIISYHSLEDRIVKRFINNGSFSKEVEKDFFGNFSVPFKKTGSFVKPSKEEISKNIRSRSAKLRVAEKL